MKHLVKYLALAGIMTFGLIGCGDDDPSSPNNPGGNDPTYVEFKSGDTMTFHHYTRDVNNNRVNSSKSVRKWTVLDVNASVGGRTGVAMILEQGYDSTGRTAVGERDTFYLHSSSDGKIYWYNLLRSVVKRIPGANSFIDSVPPRWIQIGDTKASGSASWQAIEGGPVVDTVSILTTTAVIKLTMNVSQVVGGSVTVPAGTYAKTVRADHDVIVGVTSQFVSSNDTLRMGYTISPKDGVLRQTLKSQVFQFTQQEIPGFEMELVAVAHKK